MYIYVNAVNKSTGALLYAPRRRKTHYARWRLKVIGTLMFYSLYKSLNTSLSINKIQLYQDIILQLIIRYNNKLNFDLLYSQNEKVVKFFLSVFNFCLVYFTLFIMHIDGFLKVYLCLTINVCSFFCYFGSF